MEKLMILVKSKNVLNISNPSHTKSIWKDIFDQYNIDNDSGFTHKQIKDKYKNYKKALKTQKSKLYTSRKKTGRYLQIIK